MGFARGYDIIVRFRLLEHQPHGFDVFFGVTPVAFGFQITHEQFVLQTGLDARNGPGDFARHKILAAPGGFVVEKNAVAGVQPVGFTVVYRDPVGVDFGARIGAAWVKGC